MTSTEKSCLGCNCTMDPDNTIIIDDEEVCTDCASEKLSVIDITNNDDIFDIVSQNLELEDLINIKNTIKGVSPNINQLINIKKQELLNKNLRTGEANFYNLSGENYPTFLLANIGNFEDGNPHKMFKENINFFGNPTEILSKYFNGDYDFFDTDGNDYPTFAELLDYIIGVDEEESKEIQDYILAGSPDVKFSNSDLLDEVYEVILKTLVLDLEPDSSDFYYYKVEKFIQKDSSVKIGDVVYAQEYMTSRPQYGIALVGWDFESSKKILVTDGEGQPELPKYIIDKLVKNHVTYNMVNDEVSYLIMDNDDETSIATWVLPSVCLRITKLSLERNLM